MGEKGGKHLHGLLLPRVARRVELSHLRSIQRMCILSNKQTSGCGAAASDQDWEDSFWFVLTYHIL